MPDHPDLLTDDVSVAASPLVRSEWALRRGLQLFVVVVLASTAIIVGAHITDRYTIGHTSGTFIALTQQARSGTRYMPVPIEINAAAASITRDDLVSGKVVSLFETLALLALMWSVFRGLRSSWGVCEF